MIGLLFLFSTAQASIDPDCQKLANQGPPADYDEQAQADFLLNYVAMAMTFSPLHGALADDAGHGTIGVDILGIPPLGCERRLVLNYTKSEDTNKAPAAPRFRASFSFPEVAGLRLYTSAAYIPPVPLAGVRSTLVAGEFGVGKALENGVAVGARGHATMFKTIGEVAAPFKPEDGVYDDLYLSSTFGLDLMASYETGSFEPYLALGWTDASTFFYIGDDGFIGDNKNPYWGPTLALGTEANLVENVLLAAEFYAAPGIIMTGRLRAALQF